MNIYRVVEKNVCVSQFTANHHLLVGEQLIHAGDLTHSFFWPFFQQQPKLARERSQNDFFPEKVYSFLTTSCIRDGNP